MLCDNIGDNDVRQHDSTNLMDSNILHDHLLRVNSCKDLPYCCQVPSRQHFCMLWQLTHMLLLCSGTISWREAEMQLKPWMLLRLHIPGPSQPSHCAAGSLLCSKVLRFPQTAPYHTH